MNLLAHSICGRVFKHPQKEVGVVLSSLHGLAIKAANQGAIFRYQYDSYAYSAPFNGGVMDVYIGRKMPGMGFTLEKGEDYISPREIAEKLSFDQQYAIYFNDGKSSPYRVIDRDLDENAEECNLLIIDINESSLIHCVPGLDSYQAHYVDGCMYYLKRDHIQAYDKDFKPSWRFDIPDPSLNPAGQLNEREVIAHEDSVIANFCVDPNNNYAGSIYCWAKESGEVRWQRSFDFDVQELKRYNDNLLLVAVGSKLYLVCASTGQIEAEHETGLLHQSLSYKAINFYGDVICLHSEKDNKIQFYQRYTFELLREVDCTPFDFKFYKFSSIQHDHLLFIPCLQNSHKYWQFCGSMLMIDLTDIHSELTIEQGPEFDIELPSKDNGAIRLSVNHNDWGDIVRFAERHFAELVYEHGKSWLNPKHNKHFNGHLELTVKGCDAPELIEKLGVFEKRMLKIIEDDELHDKPITVKWVVE